MTAPEQHLDVRLVPAVCCCWAVAIVGLSTSWPVCLAAAAVLLAVALLARRVDTAHSPVHVGNTARRGVGVRRCGVAVSGALLLASGFSVSVAVREHALAAHPLAQLGDGARVTVTVVLTDDPKPVRQRGHNREAIVTGALASVYHGGNRIDGGGRVRLLVPGAGWLGLIPGQRVRAHAVLGHPRSHDFTVALLRVTEPPELIGPAPWWQRVAGAVRHRFAQITNRALWPDEAGLLPALVIGDMSAEPDRVTADFGAAGLTHLTAVSGENLSIFVSVVERLAGAAALGRRMKIMAVLLAIGTFVVLARPSPSVLRAAVMGVVPMLALATGRTRQALPALCGAVLVLLVLFPALALDRGFALSVAATAGLVVLASDWEERLKARRWPAKLAEAVAVAFAAFVTTEPLVAAFSGRLSPISIVTNCAVHITIWGITVVGLIAAALTWVWTPAAVAAVHFTALPLWWLLFVAHLSAKLPAVSVPSGFVGAVVGATVASIGLLAARRR